MGFQLSCRRLWCLTGAKYSPWIRLLIFFFFSFMWTIYYIPHRELSLYVVRSIVTKPDLTLVEKPVRKPHLLEFKDYASSNTTTYSIACITHVKAKIPTANKCMYWYANNQKFKLFCDRKCRHRQKIITVYDDITKEEAKMLTVKSKSVGYDIAFKHLSELPPDYVVVDNQTAYFLGKNNDPYEPQNFFHFIKQIYFPLYWLIKSTNQLHDGANNLVFYPGPYAICDGGILYHNTNKFRYFRDILHIKNEWELSAFIDKPEPHKICYKNVVFSNNYFLEKATEAIDYFKNSLNVVDSECKNKRLTILNRSNYRRILNTEELKKVGDEMGYDTQVVAMEKLTWKEQAQMIHCTNILVGVAGAGLQWAFFMKDHSGVIEIAWPDTEWFYFFTGTGRYQSRERDVIRPLKFVQLNGTCHLNPAALNIYAKDTFYKDIRIPYKESLEILHNKANYNYKKKSVSSVGKLCDITIDKESFRRAVKAAAKGQDNKDNT